MDVSQFRQSREAGWRQLQERLAKKRSFTDGEDFRRFVRLYRQVTSDLSYAQTSFPGDPVTGYLNQLAAAAYPRLYQSERSGWRALWNFLRRGFPQLFRATGGYILLSTLVSLAGALYGYLIELRSPLAAYAWLPASFVRSFQPSQAGPHTVDAPVLSSTIMTHNMLVALEGFVGGLTLGLFTLYVLWNNGIILGILAAMFAQQGKAEVFWSLIVPHGVTELTAIFIAGAAGLAFAHAIVQPGSISLAASVRKGARTGVKLFLGTVPMLAIAGTIEGFVTPSPLPPGVKFAIAAVTAAGWCLYFGLLGRRRKPLPASQPDPAPAL